MNKHRQALSLLKAGLSPILVNIQTGLAIDHTLMSADMKARVVSDQSSKKLPTLDDILGAPQGASDAAVLLLLYTAKSECAELEVDIHKLVSAHEDYLRECRLVSRSGAPPLFRWTTPGFSPENCKAQIRYHYLTKSYLTS